MCTDQKEYLVLIFLEKSSEVGLGIVFPKLGEVINIHHTWSDMCLDDVPADIQMFGKLLL